VQFGESSAAIDAHIQKARAAVAAGARFTLNRRTRIGPPTLAGSATSRIRSSRPSGWGPQRGAETVPGRGRPTLSPAPSRLFP
jgi:hypothetical protein